MSVAIFEDENCKLHVPGDSIPERPERTQVISKALRNSKFSFDLVFMSFNPTTLEDITDIHNLNHLLHVKKQVEKASKSRSCEFVNGDRDVVVSEGSNIAAYTALGAVKDAVHLVLRCGYTKRAFCNIRPPGHHACCHKAAGFCLYNNVWYGAHIARQILKEIDIEPRIAIIDWDLHHGDGTQDFVLKNTELYTFFVSIHQDYKTNYPGTGKECKKYRGNSVLINHNIRKGGGDVEVKEYFEGMIEELREWRPSLIMVSCGFDAHTLDTIGSLNYSSELYGWMTKQLVNVAEVCCGGKIVSVLEGGYNLRALEESSVFHVEAML